MNMNMNYFWNRT